MKEHPKIKVGNVELPNNLVAALWSALQGFSSYLSDPDVLGTDEMGRSLTQAYKRNVRAINRLWLEQGELGEVSHEVPEQLPDQPIRLMDDGRVRFVQNNVVRRLYEAAKTGQKVDMNQLWFEFGEQTDTMVQFYQLIGYSIDCFGEIFHESAPEKVAEFDGIADGLRKDALTKLRGK